MSKTVRIVVADDSPFVCRLLARYLSPSEGFEIVAFAHDGKRAAELVKENRPDAVTLDLGMPLVNGLEALSRIMRECPTPVVVVSGVSGRSATMTLQALDFGAVDFVLKFSPGAGPSPEALQQEIVAKVRAAAGIKVVRSVTSYGPAKDDEGTIASVEGVLASAARLPGDGQLRYVVVVGASTGGPLAVRELLSELPGDFPASVLIVQHLPESFTGVLAAQLNRQVPLRVREASTGDALEPGLALVAPGGHHLVVRRDMSVELRRGPEIRGHCPSVDVTLQSAARALGERAHGVVLTGMGDDGARGLAEVKVHGGTTYAQDAASCVVNGMPQRAIDLGVVDHIANPPEIAHLLRAVGREELTEVN